MKVLVSPMNKAEAIEALEGDADIIDVKNPAEGSLGANFPWIIREIAKIAKNFGKEVSATTGDLPFKPGTASLAALGAAISGADYIKVGFYGVRNKDEAEKMVDAVVKAVKDFDGKKKVVIAGYADYKRINAISPLQLPEIAAKFGADVVMVDTAIKDGTSLFDHLNIEEIKIFVESAHSKDLLCALAGNLGWKNIDTLKTLKPDIIGVRTMVCEAGRNSMIKRELVKKLVELVR
ncbi:MAG: (5-formylfuran-3-yl)methyl phosphate synthase [Archaeoglobaceae archaeon]|nr:(5-formylfuran-3-yl)methyl phosphate synthase [Archaeoglobaceae archaeon]MCX8151784.1 (5-formylfuran-3-yl)methyl phosphate synthase [Archaeoglobaceae archaeon]MDW8013191.1 (5-formylfuran-3-yl)methyl phosphate synthase [Archaeoglobaceae archaeon]